MPACFNAGMWPIVELAQSMPSIMVVLLRFVLADAGGIAAVAAGRSAPTRLALLASGAAGPGGSPRAGDARAGWPGRAGVAAGAAGPWDPGLAFDDRREACHLCLGGAEAEGEPYADAGEDEHQRARRDPDAVRFRADEEALSSLHRPPQSSVLIVSWVWAWARASSA